MQQRLVVLGRAPAGVGRLAQAAQRAAGALLEGVAPEWDQPGWVASGNSHVDESHLIAGRAEAVAQQRGLLGWQHGHDRFPRRQTVLHERHRKSHELLVRRVDEGVVLEPGGAPRKESVALSFSTRTA